MHLYYEYLIFRSYYQLYSRYSQSLSLWKYNGSRHPRFTRAEFTRRGNEIYEINILSVLTVDQTGIYVAIDIETGVQELEAEALAACNRLIEHWPDC